MTLLARTARAVLAGARSLLERLGTAVDPLVPKRPRPARSTIRRVLAGVDADALDRAVGA
ncbi:hypothetical protein ACFFUA_11095 [Streptomyces heliomycini]|uniref:Uncharacterized protein n=1 Tax=Streptomyces heliomycini TaxID=284032 RepID=A0ABV5L9C1_9ACTN|nr:hypothetical protein [Streptomyces sp. XY152]